MCTLKALPSKPNECLFQSRAFNRLAPQLVTAGQISFPIAVAHILMTWTGTVGFMGLAKTTCRYTRALSFEVHFHLHKQAVRPYGARTFVDDGCGW